MQHTYISSLLFYDRYYPLGHKYFLESNSNIFTYYNRNKKNKPFWQKYEWSDDFFSKKLGNHAILCKVKNTYNEFPLSMRKQGRKKKLNNMVNEASSLSNFVPLALHLVLKPLEKLPVQETYPKSQLKTNIAPNVPLKINPQRHTKLDNTAEMLKSSSQKKPKEDNVFKVHIFPHADPPFVVPFVWAFKHYHELSLHDCVRFKNRHLNYIERGKWVAGRIIAIAKDDENNLHTCTNHIPVDDLKLIEQSYLNSNEYNQGKPSFDSSTGEEILRKNGIKSKGLNSLFSTNIKNWPKWNSIIVHLFEEYGSEQCKVSPWEIILIDNEEKNDSTSMKTRYNGKPRWTYSPSTKIADSLVYTLDNVVRKKLEDALISFSRKENLKPFYKKITKATAPLYYTVVPLPMYIEKILRRLKYTSTHGNINHCYYRSSGSLMSDIYEIINNCVLYNNPRSSIVDDAIQFGQKMKNTIAEAERDAKNEQRQRMKQNKNGRKKSPTQSTRPIDWNWIYRESRLTTKKRYSNEEEVAQIITNENLEHRLSQEKDRIDSNHQHSSDAVGAFSRAKDSLNNPSRIKVDDIEISAPVVKDFKEVRFQNDAEPNINLNGGIENAIENQINISQNLDLQKRINDFNAKPEIDAKEQANCFQKKNENILQVESNSMLGHQYSSKKSSDTPCSSAPKVMLKSNENNKLLLQNTAIYQSGLSSSLPSKILINDTKHIEVVTVQERYKTTLMEHSWLPQAGDSFFYNENLHANFVSYHLKSLTESQRVLPSIPLSCHGEKWIRGHIVKVRFLPPNLLEVPPYSFEQCLPIAQLHVLFDCEVSNPQYIYWRPCRLPIQQKKNEMNRISNQEIKNEMNTMSPTQTEECNKKIGCNLYEKAGETGKCLCGLHFKLSFIHPCWVDQSCLVTNAEEEKIDPDLERRILNCFEILRLRCINDVSPNYINADEVIKNIECRPYQHQKEPAMNPDPSSYFAHTEHRSKLLYMCFHPLEDKKGHMISPKICFNIIINRVRNGYYRDKVAIIDDLHNCFLVCSLNLMKHMAQKIMTSLRIDETQDTNKSCHDFKSLKSNCEKKTSQYELNEARISCVRSEIRKKGPLKLTSKEVVIKSRIQRLRTLISAALLSVNFTEEMEIILCIRKPPFKPDTSYGRTIVKNDLELSGKLLDSLAKDRADNHKPLTALEPNPTVKVRVNYIGVEDRNEQCADIPSTILIEPENYEGNKKMIKGLFGTANKKYACIRCQATNRDMLHCRIRKGHSNPDFDILGFAKSGGLENLLSRLKSHLKNEEAQNNSIMSFKTNSVSSLLKESLVVKETDKCKNNTITITDSYKTSNDAATKTNTETNEANSGTEIEIINEKDCFEETGDFDCNVFNENSEEDITPKMLLNMTEYAVLLADMNVSISKSEMDSSLILSETFIRENFPIDENDGHYEFCTICGIGGDVLCCEGCPCVAHKHCVNLKDVPEGDWFCSYCVDTNMNSKEELKIDIDDNVPIETSPEEEMIGESKPNDNLYPLQNQPSLFKASTVEKKPGGDICINEFTHKREEKNVKQQSHDHIPNTKHDNKGFFSPSPYSQANKEKGSASSKLECQTKFGPESEYEANNKDAAKPTLSPDNSQMEYVDLKDQNYNKCHVYELFENASTFEDLMEIIRKYRAKHKQHGAEPTEQIDKTADSNLEPHKNENKLQQRSETVPSLISGQDESTDEMNNDIKDTNQNNENTIKNVDPKQVGTKLLNDHNDTEINVKVGTKILKSFHNQGNFVGTVKRLPTRRNPYFKIVYGDGDKEELSDGEVHGFARDYLIKKENTKKSVKKQKISGEKEKIIGTKGKRGRPKKRKNLTKVNCKAKMKRDMKKKKEGESKDTVIRNFSNKTKRRGRPRKVR